MVEGWAVYGTSLVVARGFGDDKNDRYRFFELRGRMVAAANLILDVRLHRGEITDEEALRFLVKEGFQEQAAAEKKLVRAKLDSTQLCQYFLGLDELEVLHRDAVKAHRGLLDEGKLNEQLIGHGAIAVRFLRQYVLHPLRAQR
jgi:uncharacterized protein (DUF885 family)